jgi:hypothetical protein
MKILRLCGALATLALSASMLTGCSATVNLDAAEDANNPVCAEQMVRLPDEIETLTRRTTNAQSTGAWGVPASVIFRCGVAPVEASTLPCVTASDVDWLVDDSNAPSYRFITFARTPATEVIVDSTEISGATALDALSTAVSRAKVSKRCSG